jgi:hypothetical protein
MNCRYYQIILRVKHFYTNRERCGTYHWGIGVWATLDKTFYYLLFKQEVAAPPVTSMFSSLSHSSTRSFLIIYSLYYALMTIILYLIIILEDCILFTLQNSHGHVKGFLRYLLTIWSRVLKKFRQPCSRLYSFEYRDAL